MNRLDSGMLVRKAMRVLNRAMRGKPITPEQLRAAETTIRVFSSRAPDGSNNDGGLGLNFVPVDHPEQSSVDKTVDIAAIGIELYGQRKKREIEERHKSQ